MDPLSLALGAAGVGLAALALFEPGVKACFEIWGLYELSQNYGTDYRRILRRYRQQVCRTAAMMTEEISTLAKVPQPQSSEAREVLDALADIKTNIALCEDLMGKHGEPLGPRYTDPRTDGRRPLKDTNVPSSSAGSQKRTSTKKRLGFGQILKRTKKGDSSSTISRYDSPSTTDRAGSTTTASSVSEVQNVQLSGKGVQNAQDQMIRDGEKVQSNSHHKTRWLVSDKTKFEEAVKEIKSSNNFLQDRLLIKYVIGEGKEGRGIHNVDLRDASKSYAAIKKSNMEHLHKMMQEANSAQAKSLHLSIPLLNEQSKMLDEGYVRLSGGQMSTGMDKYAFYTMQNRQQSDAVLLMIAEFRRLSGDSSQNTATTVPSLTDLEKQIKEITHDTKPPLQCLGKFGGVDGREAHDGIYIYQDVSQSFRRGGSLAEELQDPAWLLKDYQADLVRLARSIAEAFLVLETTFGSRLPKPADLVYFVGKEKKGKRPVRDDGDEGEKDSSSEDEQDAQTNRNLQKLSTLSLTSGFGAAIVQDTVSLMQTAQSRPPNVILALGLILFQIGSWRSIAYKMNARVLEERSSEALGRLTDVDKFLAGQYTRVVEACLRWKDDDLNSSTAKDMLERVVATLRNYEIDLRHRFP